MVRLELGDAHMSLFGNSAHAAGQRMPRPSLGPAEDMQSPQVHQDVLAAALTSVCSPAAVVRAAATFMLGGTARTTRR